EDHGAGELEASVDALLLGSHTYEFALKLGQWPSPNKLSWVFTRRDLRILHPSITLTPQSPREVVELVISRGLRRAWLMGGGKLAASFHADQLISRYIISVFPVLLGSGIPLFAPHSSPPDALRFVAGNNCAGVTHSPSGRRCHSRDKRRDRFFAIIFDPRGGFFFS